MAAIAEPIPEPTPVQNVAMLACEGSCATRHAARRARPAVTRHLFIRLAPAPRAQAVIYACMGCGAERRFGVISLGEDLDLDDGDDDSGCDAID